MIIFKLVLTNLPSSYSVCICDLSYKKKKKINLHVTTPPGFEYKKSNHARWLLRKILNEHRFFVYLLSLVLKIKLENDRPVPISQIKPNLWERSILIRQIKFDLTLINIDLLLFLWIYIRICILFLLFEKGAIWYD